MRDKLLAIERWKGGFWCRLFGYGIHVQRDPYPTPEFNVLTDGWWVKFLPPLPRGWSRTPVSNRLLRALGHPRWGSDHNGTADPRVTETRVKELVISLAPHFPELLRLLGERQEGIAS